jgi:predicted esterase
LFRYLFLFLLISVSACTTLDRHENASKLARGAGLNHSKVVVSGFALTVYSRLTDVTQPINVYIEGDGLAWLSRHQLSPDPTPKVAMALALAAHDPAENIIYMARPCQFHDFANSPCDSAYWSNARFSEKVVDAINQALNQIIASPHQKLNLFGYSGGAAIVVLLASRRNDVVSIRTVAGNLDHAYVNQIHKVDLMPESLNSIDVADMVSRLPQIHFIGVNDETITPQVAQRFIGEQKTAHCAVIVKVDANHESGWVKMWPKLLKQSLPC